MRDDSSVLRLLFKSIEDRVEADTGGNRDKHSRGKLNLVCCRHVQYLRFEHPWGADPLRYQIRKANHESRDTAQNDRGACIVVVRHRQDCTYKCAGCARCNQSQEDDDWIRRRYGRVDEAKEECEE